MSEVRDQVVEVLVAYGIRTDLFKMADHILAITGDGTDAVNGQAHDLAALPDLAAPSRRDLMTLKEAAAFLRRPEPTLRWWRHKGLGPRSFKIGRAIMYDRSDLEQWVESRHDGGDPR